jgi:RNA-directed DNA polymerase
MGNSDSISFSLSSLYRSWYTARQGKRMSSEMLTFEYSLEPNLSTLHQQLIDRSYRHGGYVYFTVHDSKKRDIAVAAVGDRVIHRLIYDYLIPIWDKHFIFDAWSCRTGKGLHGAVARASNYLQLNPTGWLWRADITKFFDSVDQAILLQVIKRRVTCPDALWLIEEVIGSYYKRKPGRGMPIGNLTSQIFANIYLNEFDRYMVHCLKPEAYLRYGDDWLCFAKTKAELELIQEQALAFLSQELKLTVNPKLNHISPVHRGVTYLGIDLWPSGHRITAQTRTRMRHKINTKNYVSYESLTRQFTNKRGVKRFYWQTLDID